MQSLYAALGDDPGSTGSGNGTSSTSADGSAGTSGLANAQKNPAQGASTTSQTAQWGVANMFVPIKRKPIQAFKPRANVTTTKKLAGPSSVFAEAVVTTGTTAGTTAGSTSSTTTSTTAHTPIAFTRSVSEVQSGPTPTSQSTPKQIHFRKADSSSSIPPSSAPGGLGDYDPANPCQFWACRKEMKRIKRETRERLLERAMNDLKKNANRLGSTETLAASNFNPPTPAASKPLNPKPELTPHRNTAIKDDVSGEEAYLRRLRMSEPQSAPKKPIIETRPTPAQPLLNPHYPAYPSANALAGEAVAHVVVLTNLVGRSEVDDDLRIETTEECAKFGKIVDCVVFEVPGQHVPDDEAVRVFVEFESLDAALKAQKDMNGRFFGGRKVTAGFWPMDKWRLRSLMD
ncbi:hypothetical protein BASA50_006241 [Batrachochytrium salamandrivorans]|uniref:RRM domain-containing protein n=1 Tax=Batrachochytrium salamandrivorans TaxID=1357716 RepID=A0ABQ8FBV4_9FUNG|nr:hypothetical protein BASA62_010186 [Batrachochytrium salamandrivorans]KAH6572246.1 hypothetical protein BASA60_006700 [Batrachochytrium salamandrivorans]KAH6587185.1 hypothetical protein BASA61_006374 [Batrachochytrium salamandrivorans]KAH6594889.1 hypothetical protein BASA50_006241 [Batrachochytrium salamandrivorans]KAH9264994.1 hypothetical protein BASA83_011510 [Batrachochytrium salamandrivorans]